MDLNTLLEEPYSGQLYWAININARGEIAVLGMVPGGGIHAYLMVPDGDCGEECEQRIAESQGRPATAQPANTVRTLPAFGSPGNWLRTGRRAVPSR